MKVNSMVRYKISQLIVALVLGCATAFTSQIPSDLTVEQMAKDGNDEVPREERMDFHPNIPDAKNAKSRTIYVSVNGTDTQVGSILNVGDEKQPLKSIEAALSTVRSLIENNQYPEHGVTIKLGKGSWLINKSLVLNRHLCGTEQGPLVIIGESAEESRILGGHVFKPADFSKVSTDNVKNRFPLEVRDRILELDLARHHINCTGPFPDLFSTGNGGIVDLYFNGQRLGIAKWPNHGYTTMKEVLDSGDWREERPGTFVYRSNRPEGWQAAVDNGLWIAGFWRVPWVIQTIKVKAIDTERKTITLAVAVPGGIGSKYTPTVDGTRKGDGSEPWYALNLPEETDLPGEFCIDFKNDKLYLLPPDNFQNTEIIISDLADPVVLLDNTEHVQLRGLSIESGLSEAIRIEEGTSNLLVGCTIRNTGGTGVVIRGGKENGILSCDLYHLGAGGISISGGDRRTLTAAENFAVNNHIHHYGEVSKIVHGIWLSGVGNSAANNLIHDGTYGGVLYGGNNHLMEYNEIHNIGLDGGDLGGFYANADWASAGNVMRYNFVHHTKGCQAFYMDDGHSSDLIYNNIAYKVGCGPFVGGGHNHQIHNNVSFQCDKGIHVDDRGIPRKYNKKSRLHYQPFQEYAEGNEIFRKAYPAIGRIPENRPEYPTGNSIENNVIAECGEGIDLHGRENSFEDIIIRDNLILNSNPGFTNAAQLDFTLKSDADPKVLGKLFWLNEHFPKTGLYQDQYRKSLPLDEETGRNRFRPPRQIFDSTKDVEASNRIEAEK